MITKPLIDCPKCSRPITMEIATKVTDINIPKTPTSASEAKAGAVVATASVEVTGVRVAHDCIPVVPR